jgi:hypothetical protein
MIPRTSSRTAFRADHGIYEAGFCAESGSSPLQAALPKSAITGSQLIDRSLRRRILARQGISAS